MNEYLSVSAEKLSAKGVPSVRSRVVNLRELNPRIDVPGAKAALVAAFGEIYGSRPRPIPPDRLDSGAISALQEKYASNDWIYGRHMKADYSFGAKFPWGDIEFLLKLRADKIIDAQVFSDAMDAGIGALALQLKGVSFGKRHILDAVRSADEAEPDVIRDICDLVANQEIWR